MNSVADAVTIVMPVLNEEQYIAQTVSSVVNTGCRIFISDSGSTDATPRICRALAAGNPRITYFPPAQTGKTMFYSFLRLAYASETPYTMLMRSRDLAGEGLVDVWLRDMSAHPDAALSSGPHYRLSRDGFIYMSTCIRYPEKLLSDNPGERIFALIDGLYYSPFYSMYKTGILRDTVKKFHDDKVFLGCDMIMMLYIAAYNRIVYSEDAIYIVRDKFKLDGTNNYLESYKKLFHLTENERKYPHNRLGKELLHFLERHLALPHNEKKFYTEKIKRTFAQKSKDLNFSWPLRSCDKTLHTGLKQSTSGKDVHA
jgi:glycosyltransferase involved in cell wall biosynthesis